MSRYCVLSFATVVAVVGCNRAPTTQAVNVPAAARPLAVATEFPELPALPPVGTQLAEPERGAAVLASAFGLLNQGKLPEAFAEFKQAQAIQDSGIVRLAIAAIEWRLAAAALADKVATEVRGILDSGRADLAAQLASDALRVFGDGTAAEMFAALKRQADALNMVGMEPAAIAAALKKEFEDGAGSHNLRAVVLAVERAVALGAADSASKKTYDELREKLRHYDDAMLRAAEQRRVPDRLEDAIASLREAVKIWGTPEVRRSIDECLLAQRARRERLIIADFDLRGDVPAVAVSRALAQELTIGFKRQFEIVSREKWKPVAAELKLELGDMLGDKPGSREFSRLTGARYLIHGSVAAVHGVTVHARLIDLRTGVIIQTARVTGPSADSVVGSLPQLVAMLQMNDDQRLSYETLLSGLGSPVPVIAPLAGLPADPEFLANAVPPPIVVASYRAAPTGGVSGDEIRALSARNAAARDIPNDHPARERAFAAAIELGDGLLRRGLYSEAQAQYQVAASLTPEPFELTSRIDKCRPYLAPKASSPFHPRVAVLDFLSSGDGATPMIGSWLADNLSGYFSPQYQVVHRDEINWYLGRLGLTLRDLVTDPAARFYLGRALDARFLVLGTIRGGASGMDISATLLDAESGNRIGSGELQVADRRSVRFRLGELARSLMAGQSGQPGVAVDGRRIESLLKDAEDQAGKANFAAAFDLIKQADQLQPDGAQIQTVRERLEERKRLIDLDANQESESKARQPMVDAERAQYGALIRAAEMARAATAARSLGEADLQSARETACGRLIAQAKTARSSNNYELAEQLLATALALQPRADVAEQLGQIRAQTAAMSRLRSAREATAAEETRRKQYETELAAAHTRLEKERRENAAGTAQSIQGQREADRREYTRLVDKAKVAQVTGQFDIAFAALFSARRIQPGEEADRLITSVRGAQARSLSQQKGDRATGDLESRLTTDSAARVKLEAQIKRNQNFYSEAMNAADQAFRFRQYDRAIKQFEGALKLIRSEAALDGLRQALDEQAQAKAAADAEAQRATTDRRGENEAARLLIVGRADFDAGKFDEAFLSFRRAKELAPLNTDVVAWLAKAEKARSEQRTGQRTPAKTAAATAIKPEPDPGGKARRDDQASAKSRSEPKPAADPATRLRDDFNRLVEQGRTALASKRFDDAQKALDNALRLVPGDKEAEKLLLQARDGAQPIVAYTRHLQAASAFEKQEKFAEALQEYKEALAALPNDPAATKRSEYVLHMEAGTRLFKANKKSESAKEFEAALKVAPDDAAAKAWLRKTTNP